MIQPPAMGRDFHKTMVLIFFFLSSLSTPANNSILRDLNVLSRPSVEKSQTKKKSWAGSDTLPKADPDQKLLLNFQKNWFSTHIQNENMISFGFRFYWELFKYLNFIKPRAEITDECMAFLARWNAWKFLSSSQFLTGIVTLAIYLGVNKTHSASWHFSVGFFYFLRHLTAGLQ